MISKTIMVLAIAADTDIDVDLFGGLHEGWSNAPRLQDSQSYYPLLEIENSPWKEQLPEWRHRDDPAIKHFRAISAECSFDILGEAPSGVWMPNNSNPP